MLLLAVEILSALTTQGGFSAKMVFNDAGAIFFAANLQHLDQESVQISCEDNHAGNALAAMLAPRLSEIRYHKGSSDARVAQIIQSLLAERPLAFLRDPKVSYQGRALCPRV